MDILYFHPIIIKTTALGMEPSADFVKFLHMTKAGHCSRIKDIDRVHAKSWPEHA